MAPNNDKIKDSTLDIFQVNGIKLDLSMITINAEMDKTGIESQENDNQLEMEV